jgi:hypothetical protein
MAARRVQGIERLEVSDSSGQVIYQMMDYFDGVMRRFIVGQDMSSITQPTGIGGDSQAELKADTKYRILKYDCANVEETLTTDLVEPLRGFNHPEADFDLRWKFALDKPNAEKALDAAKTVYEMGAELDEAEVMEFAGLSTPKEGDKVLKKQDPQPPMGMPGQPGQEPGEGEEGEDTPGTPKPKPMPLGLHPPVPSDQGDGKEGQPAKKFSKDAQGLEHKGKGEGGGQFTKKIAPGHPEAHAAVSQADSLARQGNQEKDPNQARELHRQARTVGRGLYDRLDVEPLHDHLGREAYKPTDTEKGTWTGSSGIIHSVDNLRRMFHGLNPSHEDFPHKLAAVRQAARAEMDAMPADFEAQKKALSGRKGGDLLARLGKPAGVLNLKEAGETPYWKTPGGHAALYSTDRVIVWPKEKIDRAIVQQARKEKQLKKYSKDAQGHEHAPPGSGHGGEFVSQGGGSGSGQADRSGSRFTHQGGKAKTRNSSRFQADADKDKRRETEDAQREKARAREDKDLERDLAKREKSREKADSVQEKERGKQDQTISKQRDKEDTSLQKKRDKAEESLADAREAEDIAHEAQLDQEMEALSAKHEAEEQARVDHDEAEEAAFDKQHEHSDQETIDREWSKVSERQEAERVALWDHHGDEDAALEAEHDRRRTEYETKTTAQREAEDEDRSRAQEAEDAALEAKREEEDSTLEATRLQEDEDMAAQRQQEDEAIESTVADRRGAEDEALQEARDKEDEELENNRNAEDEQIEKEVEETITREQTEREERHAMEKDGLDSTHSDQLDKLEETYGHQDEATLERMRQHLFAKQATELAQLEQRHEKEIESQDQEHESWRTVYVNGYSWSDQGPRTFAKGTPSRYQQAPTLTWNALPIVIEVPRGQMRTGKDNHGTPWSHVQAFDYGYIPGRRSGDGEHVDVFVGDDLDSRKVYLIDQRKEDGSFDETKVMLGFPNRSQAIAGYLANYPPDWDRFGDVTKMKVGKFKRWLEEGNLRKSADKFAKLVQPLRYALNWAEGQHPRDQMGQFMGKVQRTIAKTFHNTPLSERKAKTQAKMRESQRWLTKKLKKTVQDGIEKVIEHHKQATGLDDAFHAPLRQSAKRFVWDMIDSLKSQFEDILEDAEDATLRKEDRLELVNDALNPASHVETQKFFVNGVFSSAIDKMYYSLRKQITKDPQWKKMTPEQRKQTDKQMGAFPSGLEALLHKAFVSQPKSPSKFAKQPLARDTFDYRPAKSMTSSCASCRFFNQGKCEFFAELSTNLPKTFRLDPIVKPGMMCDAWQGQEPLQKFAKDAQGLEHAPPGSSEGGRFVGKDDHAAEAKKADSSSNKDKPSWETVNHVGGIYYRKQAKTLQALAKAKITPEEAETAIQEHFVQASRAIARGYDDHYWQLTEQVEQHFPPEALKSPEWKHVRFEFQQAHMQTKKILNKIAEEAGTLADYWRRARSEGGSPRLLKADMENIQEWTNDLEASTHRAFNGPLGDAIEYFKSQWKPIRFSRKLRKVGAILCCTRRQEHRERIDKLESDVQLLANMLEGQQEGPQEH